MHDSDNFSSLDFRETSYFSATRFSNSTIMFCHNLKDILKILSNLFDNDINCLGCHEEEYWKVTNMPIMMMMMMMTTIMEINDEWWLLWKVFFYFCLSLSSLALPWDSVSMASILSGGKEIFSQILENSPLCHLPDYQPCRGLSSSISKLHTLKFFIGV